MKQLLISILSCAIVCAQNSTKPYDEGSVARQLIEKYQDQQSYIAKYEFTKDKGESLIIVIASNLKTGSFYVAPKSKFGISLLGLNAIWSPDGEKIFILKGKSLAQITGVEQMKIRRAQLLSIMGLDDKQRESILIPELFMTEKTVQLVFNHDSTPPAWPDVVTKIKSMNKEIVIWDTARHGSITVNRESGLINRQAIQVEAASRKMRLIEFTANQNINKLFPKHDLEVKSKLDIIKTPLAKRQEAAVFQKLVTQYDHEKSDLEKLTLQLKAAEDNLVNYFKKYDPEKKYTALREEWWKNTMHQIINHADKAIKKGGRFQGMADALVQPDARVALRRSYTRRVSTKIPKKYAPAITEFLLGQQLSANTANGKAAISQVQQALVNVYTGTEIEQGFDKYLAK
ncbi:MAG: hypothetical protein AB8F34_04055 [Akkermansiaceae bacterium]